MVGEFPTIYLSWPWCSGALQDISSGLKAQEIEIDWRLFKNDNGGRRASELTENKLRYNKPDEDLTHVRRKPITLTNENPKNYTSSVLTNLKFRPGEKSD